MALNVVVTGLGPLFSQAEAKQHLRVEHGDDDAIIEVYSDSAVGAVLQYCNLDTVPSAPSAIAAFKVAALLVLGDLYENREASSVQLPAAARLLVDPYRWLRV